MKTSVLIRPGARGGKYLGPDAATIKSNMSAIAIICDAKTGKAITAGIIYANGKDPGPNTPLVNIMNPVRRCEPFATDATTVGVTLSVDIDVPTTFNFQLFGPLKYIDQARLAQAEITLLPGNNIGADSAEFLEGIVIEVPGLCISNVSLNTNIPNSLSCNATVTMMCGCVIEDTPGWYWPPSDFSIQLVTMMESGDQFSYPLGFISGSSSLFTGTWQTRNKPGDNIKQAWIYASQPKLGNQGKYRILPKQTFELSADILEKIKLAGVQPEMLGIK